MNRQHRRLAHAILIAVAIGNLGAHGLPSGGPVDPETLVLEHLATIHRARTIDEQAGAFRKIEEGGELAVPFIIKHMNNRTELKFKAISLRNKTSNSFEATRHYSPTQVVDALAAVLNQLTGEEFGYISNGGTKESRDAAIAGWRNWCKKRYSSIANACE